MSFFGSAIITLLFGLFVIVIRMKSSKQPATFKKIWIPPLGMLSGGLMFVFPVFRVSQTNIIEAIVLGIVFSIVLIWTTKYDIRGEDIYIVRTKSFPFILMGLLIIRLIIKYYLSDTIAFGELAGMFWILGVSMIWPWRFAMHFQLKAKIKQQLKVKATV